MLGIGPDEPTLASLFEASLGTQRPAFSAANPYIRRASDTTMDSTRFVIILR